ncbi:MAG: low molecular weight protein arginine phosphatase [Verrucomicrobia bacterium]|nr:low molecular weight protein arginine phosphatase [Verrucomicrobiota bacterium]
MSDPKHVLFICTGNTCRSPMAEGLFRLATAGRGDFTVSSAGIAAAKGAPASTATQNLLKKRAVSEDLLKAATHVFVMTQGHLAALETRFPEHADKYFLAREFAGMTDKRSGTDIPDPIGMGPHAYEEVAQILDAAIPSIIAYIDQT